MQEYDRDRLHALVDQPLGAAHQRVTIEWNLDYAIRRHPLGHLQPQAAAHERRWQLDEDVIEVVLALTSDLQHVAETLGRYHPGRGSFPFDECIGEQGSRVHHPFEGRERELLAFKKMP